MPDISMCANALCPSKDYCHRFTATPSDFRQSYADFGPENQDDKCDHFWPNGKNSEKCKHEGVKREGEICNLEECKYPDCTKDSYCKFCHKTDNCHKMSCSTKKTTIVITDEAKTFFDQMEKEVHQNRANLNK
jgi:hypothetical protein